MNLITKILKSATLRWFQLQSISKQYHLVFRSQSDNSDTLFVIAGTLNVVSTNLPDSMNIFPKLQIFQTDSPENINTIGNSQT